MADDVRQAANDTLADELSEKVIAAKLGTPQCATMLTSVLSNGKRYWITDHELVEQDAKINRERGRQSTISRLSDDETVEAVAVTIFKHGNTSEVEWGDCSKSYRDHWRSKAKAALSAAAKVMEG